MYRKARLLQLLVSLSLVGSLLPLVAAPVFAGSGLGETENDVFTAPAPESGKWLPRLKAAKVTWDAPVIDRFLVDSVSASGVSTYELKKAVTDKTIETTDQAILNCRALTTIDRTRPDDNPTCFEPGPMFAFKPTRTELDVLTAPLDETGCPEDGYTTSGTFYIKKISTKSKAVKLTKSLTCYKFAVRFFNAGGQFVTGGDSGVFVTTGNPKSKLETKSAPDPKFVFPKATTTYGDLIAGMGADNKITLKWAIEEAPPAFEGDTDAKLNSASLVPYSYSGEAAIGACPAVGATGWVAGTTVPVTPASGLLPSDAFDAVFTGDGKDASVGQVPARFDGKCRYWTLVAADNRGRVGRTESPVYQFPSTVTVTVTSSNPSVTAGAEVKYTINARGTGLMPKGTISLSATPVTATSSSSPAPSASPAPGTGLGTCTLTVPTSGLTANCVITNKDLAVGEYTVAATFVPEAGNNSSPNTSAAISQKVVAAASPTPSTTISTKWTNGPAWIISGPSLYLSPTTASKQSWSAAIAGATPGKWFIRVWESKGSFSTKGQCPAPSTDSNVWYGTTALDLLGQGWTQGSNATYGTYYSKTSSSTSMSAYQNFGSGTHCNWVQMWAADSTGKTLGNSARSIGAIWVAP